MANLDWVHWIMANPLYGTGLRLMECLRIWSYCLYLLSMVWFRHEKEDLDQ